MNSAHPYVYLFGPSRTDGSAAMKNLLGGKGANLAEMSNLGLPVPPGFTITTEVCAHVAQGFAGGTAKGNTELTLPESIPADELMGRRMEIGVVAVLGLVALGATLGALSATLGVRRLSAI